MQAPRIARLLGGVLAATALAHAARAEERILVLSAYSPEQAVLLAAAGVDGPEDEVGAFNGRRFFAGRLAGHDVVLGLTGIGLVDARNTARAALDGLASQGVTVSAIVFSGVGGGPNIGDVVVPDRWSDGAGTYPVSACMLAVASGLGDVPLNPYLPVEDAACTGRIGLPNTPVRTETDPVLRIGGLGSSSDPFNGRAVPCAGPPGPALLGCEACGAPLDTSPDLLGTIGGLTPFLDPTFYLDLLTYFSSPPPPTGDPVMVDMETAAVAKLASERGIPFLAFRAVSDGGGDPIFASALIGFPVQFLIYQQLAADNAAAIAQEFFARWSPPPAIAIDPPSAVVKPGKEQSFHANVPCLASDAVVWSVAEANGGTIDANGLYRAPKLWLAPRTVHVVAKSAINGSVSAVATVSLVKGSN